MFPEIGTDRSLSSTQAQIAKDSGISLHYSNAIDQHSLPVIKSITFAMKPILFTLIATACYSVCNVLLELKFSKLNALTLIILYASVIWISAFGMRQLVKTDDPSFNFPKGTFLLLSLGLGLIYAAGDYFFVS